MAQATPPKVLNLVLADAFHQDGHGKYYLMGILKAAYAPGFPAKHKPMAVYVSLTDGRGEIDLGVRLVCVRHNEAPCFKAELKVKFSGPLDVGELAFMTPVIRFPHDGEFQLQVLHGVDVLADRKFMVYKIGEKQ